MNSWAEEIAKEVIRTKRLATYIKRIMLAPGAQEDWGNSELLATMFTNGKPSTHLGFVQSHHIGQALRMLKRRGIVECKRRRRWQLTSEWRNK